MNGLRARPWSLSVLVVGLGCICAAQEPFEPLYSGAMFHADGVGSQGGDLVAADLDGDGHQDAVASYAESSFDTLKVFLGRGDGSLEAHWGLDVPLWTPAGHPRLALVDLDGDGALDLAAGGSAKPESISVLSGDGTGSFHDVRQVRTLGWPSHVCAADFDLDGRQDLLVGVHREGAIPSSALCLLLGDGQGSFAPGKLLRLGLGPQRIIDLRVGDVTSDGLPDVVAAIEGGPALLVRNAGHGSFEIPRRVSPAAPVWSLALHDFDGDGLADLAIGIHDAILLLRGDGNGQFEGHGSVPMPRGERPWRIDAMPQGMQQSMGLLVQEQRSQSDRFRFGLVKLDAGLSGGRIEDFPTSDDAGVLAPVDLDEDGSCDVLSRSAQDWLLPALTVFFGGSEGGQRGVVTSPFDPPATASTYPHLLHRLEDLDGDQVPDAIVSPTPAQLDLYLGRTTGQFERGESIHLPTPIPLDWTASPVVVGDLDGDGLKDLAVSQSDFYFALGGPICEQVSVSFVRGVGNGAFAPPQELVLAPIGRCSTDIDLVDLFDDGSDEVVLLHTDGGLVSIAGLDATGSFKELYTAVVSPGGQIEGARDIDGDGREEILLLLDGTASLQSVWSLGWNPVSGLEAPVELLALPQDATGLALGDYDGDGWLDALIGEDNGHFNWGSSLSYWRGHATGAFAFAGVERTRSHTVPLPPADLDGDGASELLARLDGVLGGRLGVWKAKAAPSLLQEGEYLASWAGAELADMDLDGYADLVYCHFDRLVTCFNLASGQH